ncbi:hypothetical protein [Phenylobacterium sp.]|uniref:hypothetical protein n=1 Tax=Phenylobacterium sp. TaxID=1871053 RepID=UPI0025E077EA|nr:hypothetical protein [Phenylobacterium sp.]MBX3483182.1 hypothetical protein [Phenylobacterium sp.]MCW5760550.1 hypothetical protein [Phenylobacterium sp.]
MPQETRDRDPYWAARMRMTPEELEEIRRQARQTVNDRETAATRGLTPAQEASRRMMQEGGEAVRRLQAEVQSEIDRQIADAGRAVEGLHYSAFGGQPPETPRSTNPVARWAEGRVGRGGYGWIDPAPEARGRLTDQLPRSGRGIGEFKCNQFVWDALGAGGSPAGRMTGGGIPVAKDWGNPSSKIPGYMAVNDPPQPGDVISNGHHVGIYSPLPNGRPGTVSAASPRSRNGGQDGGVVHNDWGFQGTEGPVTVWRSTMGPARR